MYKTIVNNSANNNKLTTLASSFSSSSSILPYNLYVLLIYVCTYLRTTYIRDIIIGVPCLLALSFYEVFFPVSFLVCKERLFCDSHELFMATRMPHCNL